MMFLEIYLMLQIVIEAIGYWVHEPIQHMFLMNMGALGFGQIVVFIYMAHVDQRFGRSG